MVAVPARGGEVLAQLAVGQRSGVQAGVSASLVEGHRVEGGEHADVRQDGRVVLAVAVAVGADVLHKADVEGGAVMADGGSVLGHLAVQHLVGAVAQGIDGVEVAGTDAAAAALALVLVDDRLVLLVVADGVGAALLGAAMTAAAEVFLHRRVAGGVLLHLAGAGAAAHADVLDGTAEAGGLVTLEVAQADEDVGVHDGAADLSGLAVFAVRHRHLHLIGAAQAVGDDDLTAGGHGPEAVQLGAGQVLEGVLSAARIQGIAVSQEGHTALLLAQVGHHLGVVGAQIGQVAQLAEMHLDGDELALHVDVLDACRDAQAAQLIGEAGTYGTAEIGIVDGRCFHRFFLLFSLTISGAQLLFAALILSEKIL